MFIRLFTMPPTMLEGGGWEIQLAHYEDVYGIYCVY